MGETRKSRIDRQALNTARSMWLPLFGKYWLRLFGFGFRMFAGLFVRPCECAENNGDNTCDSKPGNEKQHLLSPVLVRRTGPILQPASIPPHR
jgi:hypothetical protein